MLTKKDMNYLEEKFTTKAEFHNLEEKIDDVAHKLGNDITTFKDAILYEIQGLREEVIIVLGYRQHIEDHDERIEHLETVCQVKPKTIH